MRVLIGTRVFLSRGSHAPAAGPANVEHTVLCSPFYKNYIRDRDPIKATAINVVLSSMSVLRQRRCLILDFWPIPFVFTMHNSGRQARHIPGKVR